MNQLTVGTISLKITKLISMRSEATDKLLGDLIQCQIDHKSEPELGHSSENGIGSLAESEFIDEKDNNQWNGNRHGEQKFSHIEDRIERILDGEIVAVEAILGGCEHLEGQCEHHED